MKLRSIAAAALVIAATPLAARADVYSFNFTPLPGYVGLNALSFTLDTSQAPSSFGPVFDGNTFYYANVPVLSNGITYSREVGFGDFVFDLNGNYNALQYEFGVGQTVTLALGVIGTGVSIPIAAGYSDTPYFTGTPGAPVFVPGTYTVPRAVSLTITDLTTVTPEPSSFALLGTGLLGLAGLLRRRPASR